MMTDPINILDRPREPFKEPNSLVRLTSLIQQANLSHSIDSAIFDILRENSATLYALIEDNRRNTQAIRVLTQQLCTERKLRAEMMEKFGDLSRTINKSGGRNGA